MTQARRLAAGEAGEAEADEEGEREAFSKVPEGFAESYWHSLANARPLTAAYLKAAKSGAPESAEPVTVVTAQDVDMEKWHEWLKLGFTLLVTGVGSKCSLLEAFADRCLTQWARVVRIRGYVSTFSLAECLRDVLETLFPTAVRTGSHNSVAALVASICEAFRTAKPQRRVCFVVHNLECLPEAHQALLATLAATPGFYVVASVDSMWAPLRLSPNATKNFNFCMEEAHTFKSYEMEYAARCQGSLEALLDSGRSKGSAPKACLGVVLKTLTPCHTELTQVIAEHQLGNGGRTGISAAQLLEKTTDRMIASSSNRLRGLLNELKDHQVVVESRASDGTALLSLTCSAKVLQRLADGRDPDESDDEESEQEGLE